MNMCNNLPLYAYNEMGKDEKEQFEKHLQNCADCRESLKTCFSVKNSLPKVSSNICLNSFDAVLYNIRAVFSSICNVFIFLVLNYLLFNKFIRTN